MHWRLYIIDSLKTVVLTGFLLAQSILSFSIVPDYRVTEKGILIQGVSQENPVIYDNDWWTDIPDAAYIWAKASLGQCDLRGNIITRCTFGWKTKYAHTLEQQIKECAKLLDLAQKSGLRNIPEPVIGAKLALKPPESGKIEDTEIMESPGSRLIIEEAHKASPEKPLLLFVGGSCTTVATALLSDPSIADRMIVFQIDGGGYNGSDEWAWKITMESCRFVNWARGYFWDKVGVWNPEPFKDLPQNPLCDMLRNYSTSDLGKANQWGDGAWIFNLYNPECLTQIEDYDGVGITVPKEGTNRKAMEAEFFTTMKNPAVFQKE